MSQRPLITTRFNGSTTAEEVIAEVDLHGMRAVVTGASSGLGAETARVLALAGADVTLAVRDSRAGTRVADRIAASTGASRPAVAVVDQLQFATNHPGKLRLIPPRLRAGLACPCR
jgi:short chain dehydrogenase